VSRDFWLLVFFMNQHPPSPWVYIRAVKVFFKNLRIYSQLKVHRHGWQMEKTLIILFGHLWEVELTYKYIFAFKFTLRSQQPDIVPIICNQCHWHQWQICHRHQQHLQNWWQIFSSVVDTGGAPWPANISANFWKNLKRS
jgi:hypothetical protein